MNLEIIYFSPTNSTKKILKTIASGITDIEPKETNLTLSSQNTDELTIKNRDLVLIGTPVYGGRVPLDAIKRFNKLKANKIPAVIIVVYGNRGYDDALLELNEIISKKGFLTIAAATFIAQHSFSSKKTPIGEGRPDKKDTDKAIKFGKEIANLICSNKNLKTLEKSKIPGNFPYVQRKPAPSFTPTPIAEKCINCNLCVKACPTGAISKEDNSIIDVEKCILCCACIKVCKNNYREITHPAFLELQNRISTNFTKRLEPTTIF